MAHNPSVSHLDATQVFKRTFDETHDAVRVMQALNTEMAIELSAEDGDSVQSVARTVSITPASGEVDCSALRRICMYGSGVVEVSPDGTSFVTLSLVALQVRDICALKIRVTGCTVVGQS